MNCNILSRRATSPTPPASGPLRRPGGFTLVELLIVVAIVVILVSLLAFTLGGVRDAGLRTTCLAQIRGLQTAHFAYMTDNRGFLVDTAGMPHGGMGDPDDFTEQPWWYFALQPYYDNALVLKSPVDESPHWSQDMDGLGVPLPGGGFRWTSYGVNDFLTSLNMEYAISGDPADLFDRLSRIPSPSNTVHFTLIAFSGTNAGSDHVHPDVWYNHDAPESAAAQYMQTDAHGGPPRSFDSLSNYGFLDGSAATLIFSKVYIDPQRNRFHPRRAASHLLISGH